MYVCMTDTSRLLCVPCSSMVVMIHSCHHKKEDEPMLTYIHHIIYLSCNTARSKGLS